MITRLRYYLMSTAGEREVIIINKEFISLLDIGIVA